MGGGRIPGAYVRYKPPPLLLIGELRRPSPFWDKLGGGRSPAPCPPFLVSALGTWLRPF